MPPSGKPGQVWPGGPLQEFNFSGDPCGYDGQHPCPGTGPGVKGGWYTVCGSPGQQVCGYVPPAYKPPDSTMGAWNPETAGGQAYGAAAAATGLSLSELAHMNDLARRGLGPPAPGFGPDGQPLPPATGLSPLGYAAGGVAVGAVLSAFVGYRWYYGAALGAGAGYLYARLQGSP